MKRNGREGDKMEEEVGMEGEEGGGRWKEWNPTQMSGLHQLSVKGFYQLGVHHFKSQRLGGIFVFLFLVSKMSIPCLTPYRKINSNESMTYMWVNQNLSDIQLHSQKEKGKKKRTQSWRGSWKALDKIVEKLEALCLVHCWWENKIVQPLWKTLRVLQNLNTELPQDRAIANLGM